MNTPLLLAWSCRSLVRFGLLSRILAVCAALAVVLPSKANTFTWSGGGGNGNWSTAANWGGVGTPNNGDTVVFPGGAARLTNTNDVASLTLSDIRFTGPSGGYNISGNPFTLTNSISSTNTAGANTINNNITLTSSNTTVNVGGGIFLLLDGNVNGPGGMVTTNTGTLEFAGAPPNSFTGTMWVSAGTLILNRNGVNNSLAGPLVISNAIVQLAQTEELPFTPITVNQGGLLNLNGANDFIGVSLTLNGNGSVQTGSGTLIIKSNAVINANPGFFENDSISGNMSIAGPCTFSVAFDFGGLSIPATVTGTGPINITGTGFTTLSASNSFTGQLNVLGGQLTVNNAYALGATNSSVTLSNTAQLAFTTSLTVSGKTLIDASTTTNGSVNCTGPNDVWLGPVKLIAPQASIYIATNCVFQLAGVTSGSGGFSNWGPGLLIVGGPGNTFSGASTVGPGSQAWLISSGVAISGPFTIAGTVYLIGNYENSTFSPLTILYTGALHMGSYYDYVDTLNGSGLLDIGTAGLFVGVYGYNCEFDGTITNYGLLTVENGTLKLTGNNASYTGQLFAEGGGFVVDGYFPNAQAQVTSLLGVQGFLSGKGTLNNIFVQDGSYQPGDFTGDPYCQALTLTNNAIYFAELFGTKSGTGYPQLTAYGKITITPNSYLNIVPQFPIDDAPTNGQQFTLINNAPNTSISGTFNGLPGGSIATAVDGTQYRVDYVEGARNDLVVTFTNPPSQMVGVSVSAGNGSGALSADSCNNLYVTLGNPSTSNYLYGGTVVLRSLTPGVAVTQPFSPFPDVPPGGSATNLAPFQVYTMPWLPCAVPIALQATFSSLYSGTWSVPITLESGAPRQFDNLTSVPIPDVTSITSSIPVSGLTSPIAKVQVLLQINHTYDSDLAASLVAPDGTTVNLFNHNGQNGTNFGTACGADNTETIFDDYAPTPIGSGSAPFLFSYRPLTPLAAFNGKSGTNVNNAKWFLHVSDNAVGNAGTLNCWSLRIWPGACNDGSGVCELCPNTTIYGILGLNDPLLNRLTRSGGAGSSCASPASCPGPYSEDNYYDAYTFRNGPADACINVTLNSPSADVFSAAYLNSLDPNNTCNNYLADSGSSTFEAFGPVSYSFHAASNAVFVVEVNGVGGSYGSYSLSVTGGSCQPVLDINSAGTNHIALDWTTAAGGYLLEGSPKLGSTAHWQTVTNPPLVQNGQFVVTNTLSGSNVFYRLRKPVQ